MRILKTSLLAVLVCLTAGLGAQSPYKLNLGKEIVISGASLSAGIIGTQLRANVTIYTADRTGGARSRYDQCPGPQRHRQLLPACAPGQQCVVAIIYGRAGVFFSR